MLYDLEEVGPHHGHHRRGPKRHHGGAKRHHPFQDLEEFDLHRLGRVAPQFGEYDDHRLGRVAPQFGYAPEFGDLEGIWGSITGAVKSVGKAASKVGSTVKKATTTVVHSAEKAGTLPFKAVGAVASSGVRLVSGIAKETGKLGGTILGAPVKVSMEATKGVIGGLKSTIGKITNPFKSSSSSPAATQAAAVEVAQSQGLIPGSSAPPAAAPPGSGGVSSTSSGLTTTGASGEGATFDVAAAQKALDGGASPADAVKAGEAAATGGGMSTTMKIAIAGGGAVALFIGYKMFKSRRGGGRTKS